MGFGLLLLGYISVLGVLPYSFIYYSWAVYVPVIGGLIMLAGFCRLEEYNIYFKITKYITVAYIIILLGFTPFLIPRQSEEVINIFAVVSKIIRICAMFAFHFFLISGILALAKEVENPLVEKKAKRSMIAIYVFFAAFILEFLETPEIPLILFAFTFVYFIYTVSTIYSCYMRITYEGHDEAIEKKYNAKINKNKSPKR